MNWIYILLIVVGINFLALWIIVMRDRKKNPMIKVMYEKVTKPMYDKMNIPEEDRI
jgi:hypothetical protein